MLFIENLKLIAIGIKNTGYNFILLIIEAFYFGKYLWWWKLKFYLTCLYFIYKPYHIIEAEKNKTNLNYENLIYGETPLVTVKKIFQNIQINPNDVFFDLGSGRGGVVFFVNLYYKINSIGLDVIPTFVKNSMKIKERLKLHNVNFKLTNITDEDLSCGDIFYITPTTWEEEIIEKIIQKFDKIKDKSFVVSVSIQLKTPYLKLIKSEILPFSWGKSKVYYYVKTSDSSPPAAD